MQKNRTVDPEAKKLHPDGGDGKSSYHLVVVSKSGYFALVSGPETEKPG